MALCCGDNLRPPAGRLSLAVETQFTALRAASRCHTLIPFSCDTRRPIGRRRAVTEPLCRLVKSKSSRICPRYSVTRFFCSREKCRLSVFFSAPSRISLATDVPTLEVRLYWLQNVLAKPLSQGFQFALFRLLNLISIREDRFVEIVFFFLKKTLESDCFYDSFPGGRF